CLDEDWRFVVSSVAAQTSWLHRKISINRRTFLIDNTSPYSLKRMAEYLQAGGRLVLFAEGRLSRTGSLMKLFDGTGFLLHKTRAKVITCYLRGVDRQRLTVRRLMAGVDLMARQWRAMLGSDGYERIGVLLPNISATPTVLLSLWAAKKVPAVLNYSTGAATMLACVQLAGLKRIITSRVFL